MPKITDQKGLVVNFNEMQSGTQISQIDDLIGVSFELFNVYGQLSKALIVDKHTCRVINNDYTRWEYVWPEARGLLVEVLNTLADKLTIKAIDLQYTDVFNWRGNKQDLDLSELFNKNSNYLPLHVFEYKNLWHVHQGFFDNSEEESGCSYKKLNNINLNLVELNGEWLAQVTTAHRAILEAPESNLSDFVRDNSILDRILNKLHIKNKEILSDLLTEAIKVKIKLNKIS